jgi:hypothetical protein
MRQRPALARPRTEANVSHGHGERKRKTHSVRHCFPVSAAHFSVDSIANEQCVRPAKIISSLPRFESDGLTYQRGRPYRHEQPRTRPHRTTPPQVVHVPAPRAYVSRIGNQPWRSQVQQSSSIASRGVSRGYLHEVSNLLQTLMGNSQSSKCPLWRRPTRPTARRAEVQNASPVTPT